MALVSVTRLRVQAWRHLPAFLMQSFRADREARRAPGVISVSLLGDARRTYWTRTVWSDEAAMHAFVLSQPHRDAMAKLKDWCDEAAVVHWTQESDTPPSWLEAHQRLQAEGRRTHLRHPSADHSNFRITPPRRGASGPKFG